MNGAKHPLVRAYELGALEAALTIYIRDCIWAITTDNERGAKLYREWAEEDEKTLSPELVEIGRFVVESVLGINSEREVKHDALEA